MGTKVVFDESKISDQKRLVRGEHWLMARTILRKRDAAHHKAWRVLTTAGASPRGEIECIRELMPNAHITTIDIDFRCLDAAIDAGADDAFICDVSKLTRYKGQKRPAQALSILPRFDIVNLDLCGSVGPELRDVLGTSERLRTVDGVIMCTFPYGRDVVEVFQGCADFLREGGRGSYSEIPPGVLDRLVYLCSNRPGPSISDIASVMLYQGAEMPMCAVLFRRLYGQKVSFVQVGKGDYELAAAHPDPARLYDTPQARIDALRRSHAAIKASYTKSLSKASGDA